MNSDYILVECPEGCEDPEHRHYSIPKLETVELIKAYPEKKIAYGVVIDPYAVDAHGDYVPPAEAERAAHAWMQKQVLGSQHIAEDRESYIVESYLVPYPSQIDYEAAMQNLPHRVMRFPYGNQHLHSGSWVLGVRFSDSRWEEIKKGEVTGFSYGGYGIRREATPIDKPTITFVELPV
jgi:hypothetical protein